MMSYANSFQMICGNTRNTNKEEVRLFKEYVGPLNPKAIANMVDFFPTWVMPSFTIFANAYADFMPMLTNTGVRIYKPGLTICISRADGSMSTFMNFPDGISSFEWARFSESAPDEISVCLPIDDIPVTEGAIRNSRVDGRWVWIEANAQSFFTKNNSPGYNMNLAAIHEKLFEDRVKWLCHYVNAVSNLFIIETKIRDQNMALMLLLIALYRMHICWPEDREQIESEYVASVARLDPEVKVDFGIPDTL